MISDNSNAFAAGFNSCGVFEGSALVVGAALSGNGLLELEQGGSPGNNGVLCVCVSQHIVKPPTLL